MEYTRLFLDSFQKTYPHVNFTIESEMIIKSDYKGYQSRHYLENSYREYQFDKDSLSQVISKYVAAAADSFKGNHEIQIDHIVPLIRSVDFLQEVMSIAGQFGATDSSIVYQGYNDKLIIVYAEDTKNNINYITKPEFDKLNIAKDMLLDLAVNNLIRILPDLQKFGEDGCFAIAAGGDYEASLILLKSIWSKEYLDVDGDFVIAIPNRDLLIITGSNNKNGIERVKGLATEMYQKENYQISPDLFIWTGQKFEEYK